MKKIFSISLLVLFLAQVFYLTLLSGYLQWERDYIIDNFCVNKEQPQLLCSGRCYISDVLGEELQNEQQSEKSTAPTVMVERPAMTLFCTDFKPFELALTKHNNPLISPYMHSYFYQPITSVFHPPKGSTFFLIG